MTESPLSHRLRVAHLNPRSPTPVSLSADAAARAALAADLGLIDLPEFRFAGQIAPVGGAAWELTGRLRARVVQPCVVTLDPVTTRIDEQVRRVFSPHATAPEEDEAEMPDDEIEPLGAFIDAGEVAIEALALALPLYPRNEGAALEGEEPAKPEADTRRPFAGLDKMLKGD